MAEVLPPHAGDGVIEIFIDADGGYRRRHHLLDGGGGVQFESGAACDVLFGDDTDRLIPRVRDRGAGGILGGHPPGDVGQGCSGGNRQRHLAHEGADQLAENGGSGFHRWSPPFRCSEQKSVINFL